MLRFIILTAFCTASFGLASAQDEDLVRLPGQGEIKEDAPRVSGVQRLVPGGGLLLSFDTDSDGQITQAEVASGINAAFKAADANGDKRISPLEQISWSKRLPTRDASLENPARFDPNLDRIVKEPEFTEIVYLLAGVYADETTGNINVANLKASEQRRRPQEEPELVPPPRADAPGEQTRGPTRPTGQRS